MSFAFSMLITSILSILGKFATQSFFEFVLTKVIIFAAEKLSAMSTNTIDDAVCAEIKRRLEVQP